MKSIMNDPRGSTWRRWDLHIHTPETLKADEYSGSTSEEKWNNFCVNINNSDADIAVVGVTDYLLLDNYKKFRSLVDSGKITKRFDLIIPNIELRLVPVTGTGSALNLHLLIDPDFVPQVEERIYSKLTVDTGAGRYNATRDGLIRFGKSLNAAYDDDVAYKEGARKFVIDFDTLKSVFDNDKDLRSSCLIVVSNSSNDGATGVVGHSSFFTDNGSDLDAKRQAIYRLSDAIFSATPSDRTYFLAEGVDDVATVVKKCGSLKPCIHGCDAHTDEKIFKPDERRFCWIKADPTFEGLKQIIYEPSGRVFIGEEPDIEIRVRENQRRYISSINVGQVADYDQRWGTWFKEENIPLNKELVAIIGNKGNGKSALTDIIGLLGNSHNQKYLRDEKQEELFSFLNKDKFLKGNCAASFTGDLNWYAGAPDTSPLNGQTDESIPENVEYLPQKYLEKICANIEDDEFRHKLNEVIFEYVKESDRFEQSSLDDLIKYLTNQTAADITVAKSALHDANDKVVSIEKKLTPDHKKDVQEKIRLKQADIDAHKESTPKEVEKPKEGGDATVQSAAEIKAIEDQVGTLATKIRNAQAEATTLTRQAEDLRQARQTIGRQAKALADLATKYKDLFEGEGIAFDDVVTLKVTHTKIDVAIKKKESRLAVLNESLRSDTDVEALGLSTEEEKTAKEKSLHVQKSLLENKKKEIIDQLDKPNREYQAYLAAETQWRLRQKELEGETENPVQDSLNWLKLELVAVTKTYPEALISARTERAKASKTVLAKKKSLVSFYEAVKLSIDEEIKKYGTDLGEYNISIEASLKFDQGFHDEFFGYVSQQAKGSFHGTEDGRAHLRKLIEAVPNWEDEEAVPTSLEDLAAFLHTDHRAAQQGDDAARDIFKQMKQRKDPVELYDYIFGYDYLDTKYDLKVDGKDLRELSPGERGGLLLIFYLMLDRRDIPLVIDQPEDNLDNKSVYEILVTFLKKAKKRRQIIMVTHNPNLAVVADAEQIIHVSINKKVKNDFDFVSGSIENPVINKLVVDILEGTLPAFDNRRLKYRKQATVA